MKKSSLIFSVLLLVLALTTVAASQGVAGVLKAAAGSAPADNASGDQLGRDTPSGAVLGFLQAAQSGNYKIAADYLQMSAARRQTQGPEVATRLKELMDRAFVGSIRKLSTRPDGNQEYGSGDAQTIGTFSSSDIEVPVVLVRVTDASGAKVWLFSSETLSKVPELSDNLKAHQVEKDLPAGLVHNTFLGMPLWQWLALIVAIPVALAIGWVVVLLLGIPRSIWLRLRHKPSLITYKKVSPPLLVFFAAITHRIMASYFGLPLLPRIYYFRTIGVLVGIGFFWFVFRMTGMTIQRVRTHALAMGRTGTATLTVLGERIAKAVVVGIAILMILSIIGINLTTVLAGIGIGGLAIAFAAQKTLENLFGGVSVLADEVIRVGDACKFGDRVGTVEDISLRSTRIRTPERSQLSIPNGSLATMNVENLSRRDKFLFNPVIGLRYETTPDQLRYVLAQVRRMLYQHPKVESDAARIRFTNFDTNSLRLEVFSYVITRDYNEFAAIQEDLLFRIMDIVHDAGTDFAFPSQTLYMGRDSGIDKQKTEEAERQVQQWRDAKQLPFPDFAPEDKAAFRGTIEYPHPESALGPNRR